MKAIHDFGYPVFAKGKRMISATQVPIACAGQLVRPGDLILNDETGVVAIPRKMIREVMERAEEIMQKEAKTIERLRTTW